MMHKKIISIILLLTILGLSIAPITKAGHDEGHHDLTTEDLQNAGKAWNFISTIRNIASYIKTIQNMGNVPIGNNLPDNVPHLFIFGGHITHSEGGCSLNFKVKFEVFSILPVSVSCPGGICALPLGGNTLEVGPPISSPEGQMFTLPFISDVYANHNEGKTGPWALGIGFAPFPIDEVNDALGNIPDIYITTVVIYGVWVDIYIGDWYLDCSDSNKNIILKMGTS